MTTNVPTPATIRAIHRITVAQESKARRDNARIHGYRGPLTRKEASERQLRKVQKDLSAKSAKVTTRS